MGKVNSEGDRAGWLEFDLLGDPVPRNKGRQGRPEHVPTDANRRVVVLAFAMGRSDAEVATMLGITLPTLRKHYFSEWSKRRSARLRVDGVLLMRLAELADAGNVAAIKALDKKLTSARLGIEPSIAPTRKAKKDKPLGKKEGQQRAAYRAHEGTSWGDLLPN